MDVWICNIYRRLLNNISEEVIQREQYLKPEPKIKTEEAAAAAAKYMKSQVTNFKQKE